MTVHISKLSGKLDGFRAINSDTTSNPFCIKMNTSGKPDVICTHCYSMKSLKGYRANAVPALKRNDILAKDILSADALPKLNDIYFRIHAHGEIINLTHAINLLQIINFNKQTKFGWWTKRKDIINKLFTLYDKPDNLSLIYSNPIIDKVMSEPPRWFDRTFNNVDSPHASENCTGQQCKNCLLCYTPGNGVTTIIERVK